MTERPRLSFGEPRELLPMDEAVLRRPEIEAAEEVVEVRLGDEFIGLVWRRGRVWETSGMLDAAAGTSQDWDNDLAGVIRMVRFQIDERELG